MIFKSYIQYNTQALYSTWYSLYIVQEAVQIQCICAEVKSPSVQLCRLYRSRNVVKSHTEVVYVLYITQMQLYRYNSKSKIYEIYCSVMQYILHTTHSMYKWTPQNKTYDRIYCNIFSVTQYNVQFQCTIDREDTGQSVDIVVCML